MKGQQAKTLRPGDIRKLSAVAGRSRHPERNRVMVLLSVRAGLRACEIAALTWDMVMTPSRKVGVLIELAGWAAKKGSGRRIPIHSDLKTALIQLAAVGSNQGPVILSERGDRMTAKSVVNWFARTFASCQLQGCSSHSGRRTFITQAARMIHRAGGSLRDVQELVGHRSLKTTQSYIEGDADAQRRLMRLL